MVVPSGKTLDVSEILENFGKYHLVQYFLVCLPSLFVTMININYVFVAGDLHYRCWIAECEHASSTEMRPAWWPNVTVDRCSRPVLNGSSSSSMNGSYGTCSVDDFTERVTECTEWIYESNNTIIAELNLACQPWKSNLVGTVHNIGMLFSMIITGWMSDRIGRKPTLIFCIVGSCVGHLKTFATSYYYYVSIEFLESFISGGIYPVTSMLMIEMGGKDKRVLAGVLFSYIVYLGETIFACVAMVVPYWKTLIRIINTPSIFFISFVFIIRESPRWQILNGKLGGAKKTLRIAARMNNLNIDKEYLENIDDGKMREKFNMDKYEVKEGYRDIVKSKIILKRLAVTLVARFTVGFVYYGMVINSILLPGDKYINFLLVTIMSYPGELVALFLMNRIGRKLPLIFGYLICGVTCVASAYVPTSWAKITLFLIGKIFISACYTGMITYSMELYPTSTRGTLLGLGAFASRMGAMLAPLTPMLTPISADLPPVFFGGFSLLASALLTLTPETKDLPLMDTIDQVENLAKKAQETKGVSPETVNSRL